MIRIEETHDTLIITSTVTRGMRIFMFLVGFFPLWIDKVRISFTEHDGGWVP